MFPTNELWECRKKLQHKSWQFCFFVTKNYNSDATQIIKYGNPRDNHNR